MVDRIRSRSQIPLIFMTYANVIYSYGPERFMERAKECGIYGVILPDVPYEEKAEFEGVCKANGIELISMIAPTSHDRIAAIARDAGGFVYCVSSLGVTGVRSEITTDIGAMVELVRKANPGIPVYIGFGISDPKTAREMADRQTLRC